MRDLRQAIEQQRLVTFAEAFKTRQDEGDIEEIAHAD
jgi:hypothetical protein